MVRVTAITHTCEACPAQWSGLTDDGRQVYVRYRWGYLSVRVAPDTSKDEYAAVRGDEVFGEQLGDGYDGFLSYDKLKEATASVVEFP
jgi:hypothetical protein